MTPEAFIAALSRREKFVDVTEVAEIVGMPGSTVRDKLRRAEIPAYRRGGKGRRAEIVLYETADIIAATQSSGLAWLEPIHPPRTPAASAALDQILDRLDRLDAKADLLPKIAAELGIHSDVIPTGKDTR